MAIIIAINGHVSFATYGHYYLPFTIARMAILIAIYGHEYCLVLFPIHGHYFSAFMAIFNPHFVLFYIYNFIYKMCSGRYEDVHVSGHNSRTEHPMNLSYGILDCP